MPAGAYLRYCRARGALRLLHQTLGHLANQPRSAPPRPEDIAGALHLIGESLDQVMDSPAR